MDSESSNETPREDSPGGRQEDTRSPVTTLEAQLVSHQRTEQSDHSEDYQRHLGLLQGVTAASIGTSRDEGADVTSHLRNQFEEPAPSTSYGTMPPLMTTQGDSTMGEDFQSVRSGRSEGQQRFLRYRNTNREDRLRNFYRRARDVIERILQEPEEILELDPDPPGACEEMIHQKTDLHRFGDLSQRDYSSQRCTICLTPFGQDEIVRILRCSHIYHNICVDPWLMRDIRCPNCRQPFVNSVS